MEQIVNQLIMKNMSSVIYYMVSLYNKEGTHATSEINEEHELDSIQLDRLLLLMKLVFEDSFTEKNTDKHKLYKQELYNIYKTIRSDYVQYEQWKKYNSNLWLFSSFRTKNTRDLAKKILADVRLFKEALDIFNKF